MHLNQLPSIIDSITKFANENGVLSLIITVIVLGAIASIVLLLYVLLQLIKLQFKAQENSAERDRRIDKVSEKVEGVSEKQEKLVEIVSPVTTAFDKLTQAVNANTELTTATIKSYKSLDDNVTKSYDATSAVIGLSADAVKKNSDANTEKIIKTIDDITITVANELKEPLDKVENAVSGLTDLIKTQVINLETRAISAERTAAQLELRISQLQAVNAGASPDPDHTIPLSELKLPYSPDAAEDNRKVLDDTHDRIEAAERAKLVDATGKPDPEPPTPPAHAIDPVTGEERKVA